MLFNIFAYVEHIIAYFTVLYPIKDIPEISIPIILGSVASLHLLSLGRLYFFIFFLGGGSAPPDRPISRPPASPEILIVAWTYHIFRAGRTPTYSGARSGGAEPPQEKK